jgi:tetratricopeptide (TPR) repeat protein
MSERPSFDAARIRALIDESMDLIADGNAAEAQASAEAAADALDAAPDAAPGLVALLEHLASLFADIGAFDTARAAHDRALAIQRRHSDAGAVGESLLALADVCCAQGDLDDASTYLAEAATVFEALQQPDQLAQTLQNLAVVRLRVGDAQDAQALARRAFEIYSSRGSLAHNADIAICNAILDHVPDALIGSK